MSINENFDWPFKIIKITSVTDLIEKSSCLAIMTIQNSKIGFENEIKLCKYN